MLVIMIYGRDAARRCVGTTLAGGFERFQCGAVLTVLTLDELPIEVRTAARNAFGLDCFDRADGVEYTHAVVVED